MVPNTLNCVECGHLDQTTPHFLAAFGIIPSHFRVGRHQYRARGYRQVMKSRFVVWQEVVCVEAIVN